jgi:DNA-binding response OmpR family regulator
MNKINVLAIDDEEFNLDIMEEHFNEAHINSYMVNDAAKALKILDEGNPIDVIILDRMMPVMNGMEFLKIIKENKKYRDLPVIMQTAAGTTDQIKEGIDAGVFYYLNKPYSGEVLVSLIRAASDDFRRKESLLQEMKEYGKGMSMVKNGEFMFKDMEQAKSLAILIASCLPDAERSMIALTELMINSVEHGNLGIKYDEKARLKTDGTWEEEVKRRLILEENKNKFCILTIKKNDSQAIINIKDQGIGFDWQSFIAFDPKRLMDPNGRGIMFSMNSGIDIKFIDPGNQVECTIAIHE